MPITPYTSFRKAAGHLVARYHDQKRVDTAAPIPIPPAVCILHGTIEGYAAIPDLFPHTEPFPGIIISHIADADGPVPECEGDSYTIQTPPGLVHADVYPGDSIIIEILMTIQPPGMEDRSEWPIQYRQDGIMYHLGFPGSIFYRKVARRENII